VENEQQTNVNDDRRVVKHQNDGVCYQHNLSEAELIVEKHHLSDTCHFKKKNQDRPCTTGRRVQLKEEDIKREWWQCGRRGARHASKRKGRRDKEGKKKAKCGAGCRRRVA